MRGSCHTLMPGWLAHHRKKPCRALLQPGSSLDPQKLGWKCPISSSQLAAAVVVVVLLVQQSSGQRCLA